MDQTPAPMRRPPSAPHPGRNASDTKQAKFLVLLVKDKGAPILVPVNK
jgi:hypothetical protein